MSLRTDGIDYRALPPAENTVGKAGDAASEGPWASPALLPGLSVSWRWGHLPRCPPPASAATGSCLLVMHTLLLLCCCHSSGVRPGRASLLLRVPFLTGAPTFAPWLPVLVLPPALSLEPARISSTSTTYSVCFPSRRVWSEKQSPRP